MKALTAEEYTVLRAEFLENIPDAPIDALRSLGYVVSDPECSCDDSTCIMNSALGDRALRIHETFLGITRSAS